MDAESPRPDPVVAPAGPAAVAERIPAVDCVRGLAVLGILVMNVVEFGLPLEAYENPAHAGGSTGADLAAWFVQVTLFDGKMRGLFAMLFGAGLVLLGERLAAVGGAASAADVLLRRCLWLVPFGIAHRFGLQWTGDILYQYGLLGALAVAFRHLRPRTLLALGIAMLTAFVPIGLFEYGKAAQLRTQATAAAEAAAAGSPVPDELATARRRWDNRVASIPPKPEAVQKEIAAMRGGYLAVFAHRWDYHHRFQCEYLYYYFFFDVLGTMLLGMGLMKLGFFSGRSPTAAYVALLVLGALATGGVLALAIAWQRTAFSTAALEVHAIRHCTYHYSRTLIALAWASGLLLLLRAGRLPRLSAALGAVGRMAFSNYVLQTVCCTLLFFGYGLSLYGSLSRAQTMLVVLAVTAVQVAFSLAWLAFFRFGPLEWAWRSLTYWRLQPIRRG